MNLRSIQHLLRKIEHARDLGLIEDYMIVNSCEINWFLTIKFHSRTERRIKDKLATHIQSSYEDIVSIRYSRSSNSLVVQYDNWEVLPNKVAF